jgi:hypothetical protein
MFVSKDHPERKAANCNALRLACEPLEVNLNASDRLCIKFDRAACSILQVDP